MGHRDEGANRVDDLRIDCGSIILSGVTIGSGSIVGAGSVVTKSISPCTVYAGNPAKKNRACFPQESVSEHELGLKSYGL